MSLQKQGRAPVAPIDEVLRLLTFVSNDEMRRSCLQVLHNIGHLCLLEWYDSTMMNLEYQKNTYVVLEPKWVARVLASVVTFRHGLAKNGVMRVSDLHGLWRDEFPVELTQFMMEFLKQLDVIMPLDSDRIIIPCMLPDKMPDLVCDQDPGGLRRSYLIFPNKCLPVGLMGRLLCVLLKIGRCKSAWQGGCVVELERSSVTSMRKATVEIPDKPIQDVVHLYVNGSKKKEAMRVFRRLDHFVRALLNDFYNVEYDPIVPANWICDDWFLFREVLASLQNHEPFVTSVQSNDIQRIDTLCPDLLLTEFIRVIPKTSLTFKDLLGQGAFSAVYRAVVTDVSLMIEGDVAV